MKFIVFLKVSLRFTPKWLKLVVLEMEKFDGDHIKHYSFCCPYTNNNNNNYYY